MIIKYAGRKYGCIYVKPSLFASSWWCCVSDSGTGVVCIIGPLIYNFQCQLSFSMSFTVHPNTIPSSIVLWNTLSSLTMLINPLEWMPPRYFFHKFSRLHYPRSHDDLCITAVMSGCRFTEFWKDHFRLLLKIRSGELITRWTVEKVWLQ